MESSTKKDLAKARVDKPVVKSIQKKVEEMCRLRPDLENSEIAKELGVAVENVRTAKSRMKNRKKDGEKDFNSLTNSTIQEYEIPNLHLPKSVYQFLMAQYGPMYGTLACLLLCSRQSKDRSYSLPYDLLALCAPHNLQRIKCGLKPNLNLSSDVKLLLRDCPFTFYDRPAVCGKSTFSCTIFGFGKEENETLLSLMRQPDVLVNIFTGAPSCQALPQLRIPRQQDIADLTQSLHSQVLDYAGLVDRSFSEAMQATLSCPRSDKEKIRQVGVLRRLQAQPKPLYSAVAKSVRIYPVGTSFLTLPRATRKVFFNGFGQMDLVHSQLSIMAKLLASNELSEMIAPKTFWADQTALSKLSKEEVKQITYSMVFGGDFYHALTRAGIPEHDDGRREELASVPLFSVLQNGFRDYSRQIRESKTCKDVFGREIYRESEEHETMSQVLRSIIAQQAQSYEMMIMIKVLTHLRKLGVPIWLFLHDGFILPADDLIHFEACREIVRSTGKELGIDMDLDCEVIDGGKQEGGVFEWEVGALEHGSQMS